MPTAQNDAVDQVSSQKAPPDEPREPPNAPPSDDRLRRGRQLLTGGALVMSAGVAIVGTVSASAGSWILLAGWGLLVYGLHVFGRAGSA